MGVTGQLYAVEGLAALAIGAYIVYLFKRKDKPPPPVQLTVDHSGQVTDTVTGKPADGLTSAIFSTFAHMLPDTGATAASVAASSSADVNNGFSGGDGKLHPHGGTRPKHHPSPSVRAAMNSPVQIV